MISHPDPLWIDPTVSVVGHDNIGLSEYTAPALTTVDLPRDQIGHAISAALLPPPDSSGTTEREREIVIHPEVIVRDSTGPAKKLPE